MLRVPLHRVEQGMILARPIAAPDDPDRCLLPRDAEIPLDLVPQLQRLGICDVWVRHGDLEFLDDIFDEELADHQADVYRNVRANFERVVRGCSAELDWVHLEGSIGGLFQYVKRLPTGSALLQKLDAFDNYLLSHSTNVCYLAILLGTRLEHYLLDQRRGNSPRDVKDLNMLGLGCLLHDVGKVRVPREILDKPGRLTASEIDQMRQHPHFGHELVRAAVPAAVAEIVLNHHQRWNGGGYPARLDAATGRQRPPLAGMAIPVFARIAALADVYDAATTQRCYSPAKLPVQALFEMRTQCRGFFDPVIERAFYRLVPAFPIGQVVGLSDGCEAVVVDFSPHAPECPKVQCLRAPDGEPFSDPALEEIDLALDFDRHIVSVNGVDVRPFMTPQAEPELVEV